MGAWISSYVVMQGITDKEGATAYSAVFWISMTIFRFAATFLPGTITQKIKYCITATIVIVLISSLLAFGGYIFEAAIMSSYILGIALAAQYPYYMTWPSEFGMEFNTRQAANIMIFSMLGEAGPSVMIGYLMGWENPNWLFYSLLILSIILFICFLVLKQELTQISLSIRESISNPEV